jgi:hypothetical protein
MNKVIIEALTFAFRPLVRLALKNSIKLMDLFEVLKVVFVQVAEQELNTLNHEISVSRISIMSGVHRRDVTRIYRDKQSFKQGDNIITKVLGQWKHNPRFTTKSNKPRSLSIEGVESEFATLVSSVSQDLAPYTVLYELERLNLVKRRSGQISLTSGFNITTQADYKQGYQMLAEDMQDLIEAVNQNLNLEDKSQVEDMNRVANLHLKTEFDNIAPQHLAALKEWLLKEGSKFQRKVENHLSSLDLDTCNATNKARGESRVRAVFGSFSLVEEIKGGN